MDVFKDFATDEKAELEGAWKQLAPGAEVLVARAGNKKYARLLSKLVEHNQRALDVKNEEADALSDKIMIEVMASTVLLGWRGENFKYKGDVLSYSADNAKMVLAVKDFRNLISQVSNDIDNFRVKAEEAQVKS